MALFIAKYYSSFQEHQIKSVYFPMLNNKISNNLFHFLYLFGSLA